MGSSSEGCPTSLDASLRFHQSGYSDYPRPLYEALFLAIVKRLAEQYVSPAVQRLEESVDADVREALQRFGEQFLAFISDPEAVASYRVVISEAAPSDIGESFYETGPMRTIESIARYLAGAVAIRPDLRLPRQLADPVCFPRRAVIRGPRLFPMRRRRRDA
jgi:AcrR family transcriptional regulator